MRIVLIFLLLCAKSLVSQEYLSITIQNPSGFPLEGAEVLCQNDVWITNDEGVVRIPIEGMVYPAALTIRSLGYSSIDTLLSNLPSSSNLSLRLHPLFRELPELEVIAGWVARDEPFVHSTLEKEGLAPVNLGKDLPMLLESQPSVTTTSDAGNGIGYTSLRVRGTDLTRINISVDGIPLNEAESQLVFWVNLPDLLSTAQSIQVQRGVGPSSNGTGIFGATVNLVTEKFSKQPFVELNGSYGSFNSSKLSASFSSGEFSNGLSIMGRFSKIQSNGYIDRAFSDLESANFIVAHKTDKSLTHFKVLHGQEKTYQAWYAVPYQYAHDPALRTFNTAGQISENRFYDNETDNYSQTHLHLVHSRKLASSTEASFKAFYVDGGGYFEQYRVDADRDAHQLQGETKTDLIRQLHLGTDYMGLITNFETRLGAALLEYGLSGTYYEGDHWGQVIWGQQLGNVNFPHEFYRNDASKYDATAYISFKQKINNALKSYLDLQWRGVNYSFQGLERGGRQLHEVVDFSFFNPKVGLLWEASSQTRFHGSIALAQKEPNRDDFIAAAPGENPKHEILLDLEFGGRYRSDLLNLGINAYGMFYRDQLILTGEINDVGEYIRTNVENSRRLGVEFDGDLRLSPSFSVSATATISQNLVLDFTEFIDNWATSEQLALTRNKAPLAFSPDITAYAGVSYEKSWGQRRLTSRLALNHTGRQYLDFSGDKNRSLSPFSVLDWNAAYTLNPPLATQLTFKATVSNLLNLSYEANGWSYHFFSPEYNPVPDDPYVKELGDGYYAQIGLFPQAGRNFMVGLDLRF